MAKNDMIPYCLVEGQSVSNAFSVIPEPSETVYDLKVRIRTENPDTFIGVDAKDLTLWRVLIPAGNLHSAITFAALGDDKSELDNPRKLLIDLFPKSPDDNTYIFVRGPPRVQAPVLSDEEWQQLVVQIENAFFGPNSINCTGLVQFVKGDANIPTTGGTLGGLPFVRPRAGGETNLPSLLFLNLPESAETQRPPSTADRALEKIRERAIPLLPLFSVSGCGKTRTTIEMLSKNWGFYFNGSSTDLGSRDLLSFLGFVKQKPRYQNRDPESNIHVHILALALALTRVIILHHCLVIAEREGTAFTCKHWMLLQVAFRTMGIGDLFATLFASIAKEIHRHSVGITTMSAFTQERFSSLHQRLLNLTFSTPSQRFGYKILLVIDEAQNLSKEEFGTFPSQQTPSETERRAGADLPDVYKHPIFSPLVHGFSQISEDENLFCVIPCGTGLSIFDLKWLEDSAPLPKGYKKQLGPFTDFQGWESLEQVQNYRLLVRRSLPNDTARIIFDTRVPVESTPELFARLRGRFRPIVSAIERMIMPSNDEIDWRQAIKETEDTLSSTETEYYGKGNIAFDISQMVRRVHNFESRYSNYQNIRTILQDFVLQHFLHGRPLLLNREEAILVEASVGRILNFGKHAVTVLDEPFALRAAVNYFRQHDQKFHSAICALSGSGSKPSVHGHQWKQAVLPSLAHVFHDRILSNTSLISKGVKSYDPILDVKAKIAGFVNHLTLGIDVKTMSLDAFLDAHVHHGSCKDGKPVPPFYQPAETTSGPDVAFVLRFDNCGYCPVFVQLKMRHEVKKIEAQKAFSTVKDGEVQGHFQEAMLQRYCTGYPKQYLGVVIAYPAELGGVEGTFLEVRRSERIRSAQGDKPQCISLRIDMSNIHGLFPQNHMEALDLLKGIKRELDQVDGGQGSDDQNDEPATKRRRCEDEDKDSRVDSD
ncbi:hypothetical protein KI688_011900 [Linnemannia hyalina]|uniref:Crinkler effector protein N-terminal domain-containing protein n=1 Tax=Linnemannia hyalina TaxID=64524 RepID=A0A9P8BSH3_9FUNG|nr:hypothetical protein KI688_011900 [Linnemannia hyalina]